MKILFLTTFLPQPPWTGGKVATRCLVDRLTAAGHDVRVIGWSEPGAAPPGRGQRAVGTERCFSRSAPARAARTLGRSLWHQYPYGLARYDRPEVRRAVERELRQGRWDLVVLEHAPNAYLHSDLPLPRGTGRVALLHNWESQYYGQQAEHAGFPLSALFRREARLYEKLEARLNAYDEVWFLSEPDRARLTGPRPPSRVLPLAPPPFGPLGSRPVSPGYDVVLVGSWHWQPNRDALGWYLSQVAPRLAPDLRIAIIGDGAQRLYCPLPRVERLGYVADLNAVLDRARCVSLATHTGSGVEIKALQSCGSGLPVVATPHALRGLHPLPPTAMVAETPDAFAEFTRRAVQSPRDIPAARAWWNRRLIQLDDTLKDALECLCGRKRAERTPPEYVKKLSGRRPPNRFSP